MELSKSAGYQATYGKMSLIVTQENKFISVTMVDREKGSIAGRWTASASTIDEAKRIAEDEAKRQLVRRHRTKLQPGSTSARLRPCCSERCFRADTRNVCLGVMNSQRVQDSSSLFVP